MRGTALITGASSGLGAEFAKQLAVSADHLILVARRGDKLRSLAESIATSTTIIECDLSLPQSPKWLCERIAALGLSVDVLVNNAGVAGPNLLEVSDFNEQRAFEQLMMTTVAELCARLVPEMQRRGYGRVINVASVAGRFPSSTTGNYGPSKAYVIAVSEELNLAAKANGVFVTALCPGFTHTEFHEVAGMMDTKNSSPNWIWYEASTVVTDGINGCESGRAVVISGRLYRWLDPILRSALLRPIILRMVGTR